MSKLKELIDRLCPDGVEYETLGKVAEIRRGVRVVKSNLETQGDIPVYQNSLTPLGYYTKSNFPADTAFVISAGAAGEIGFSAIPYWGADDCYSIICSSNIISKYVYYQLTNNQIFLKSRVRTASIPRLARSAIEQFPIPVPPLEVQEEIVRILDTFSAHAAELQARKEQYEYYRNLLLTFNPSACGCVTDGEQEIKTENKKITPPNWLTNVNIQWKTMGEIGKFIRGNGLQKKDFIDSGVGCIHYGQIYTHYGTFATETKSFVDPKLAQRLLRVTPGDIILACTSENVEDVGKAVAWLGTEDIVTGGHSVVFKHNENPKYIAYFLQTQLFLQQKKKYAYGAKVIDIKTEDLAKIQIPLPALELQEKIVAILDRFETLVNDLTQGLPAEISAIKERYGYYRNKLLTFKQLA